MQINRLFEIVYLLIQKATPPAAGQAESSVPGQDKRRITASQLAAHFEVSKRTILRDIDALSAAGIPIYTTQGKGGGIFIHDHFVLNKAVVSEAEQKQILFGLQSMAATELAQADQVLGRLKSFFASSGKEWIAVDFSRWGHSAADNAKFETLKNAIIHEFAVSLNYLGPHGESKGLEVYPLKLSFKSKAWYLQSFCVTDNAYRVFKFTRISQLTALNTPFDSKNYQTPSLASVEEPALPNFVDVQVRVSPHAMYRVYDEFAEGDIMVNQDGTLSLRMPKAPWVCDYMLSYGLAVEVLAPQQLRDEMLGHIEKIKSKYAP